MAHVSAVALDHCKELAMIPGSLFEFTSRFIPAARRQQLLALYALTQSVRLIPITAVDDSVKWAKLKWWSGELAAEPAAPSRHPVLRAMWESGARKHLDDGLLLKLVNDAMMQIDAVPDAHEKAMFDRLAAQGETEILLELALDGVEIETQGLASLAAASGLFAMISGFFTNRQAMNLRLPLDLLAKYQLKAVHLEHQPPGAELVGVISQLADKGVEWFAQGSSGLGASGAVPTCTHLQLRWAMEARLLARNSKSAGAYLRTGNRYGPSDAWFAWRLCRRLGGARDDHTSQR